MLIASRQNANWFFFLFDSTFSLRSVYGMASSDRQRPSPKTHKHKCRCSHKHTKLQKSVFNIISFLREKKHLRRRRGFFSGKKNSAFLWPLKCILILFQVLIFHYISFWQKNDIRKVLFLLFPNIWPFCFCVLKHDFLTTILNLTI